MNSYENPELSYECDLTAERDRLKAALSEYEKCEACNHEERDRLKEINAELVAALHHIAITDDADCKHANDPKAMTRIARAAIAKASA